MRVLMRPTKEMTMLAPICPRTLCLWKPGQSIPGLRCVYAYRGRVPLTGRLLCMTCGQPKGE